MRPFALALFLIAAGCSDADNPAPDPAASDTTAGPSAPASVTQSVTDVVGDNARLRTLARLLDASGVAETLRDTAATYTLFAPSDDALSSLGEAEIERLASDPDAARAFLLPHVLTTRMLSLDVFPDLSIESLGGPSLAFAEAGEGLAVVGPAGTARITDADIDAPNGVVHIIDAPLVLP